MEMTKTTKKVGFWLTESKERRLLMEAFAESYKSADLEFVKIDLNYDLESQGPFDIIIHKFLDLVVKQKFGCKKSGILLNNFQCYNEAHKNIILLDPMETIPVMIDRYKQNKLTEKVVQHANLCDYVFAPNFCILDSNDISDCMSRVIDAGLQFPIVCKPEIAHGRDIAHEMRIVFDKEGLKDIEEKCVAQTFINHNARLFKIFVIGSTIYICDRPSVKNLIAGHFPTVYFNTSDVSKDESKHALTELDEIDKNVSIPQPSHDLFAEIVRIYRNESGLNLFGIDIILCNNTSKYAIIDVNSFPGYEKMPGFYVSLESLIREKLNLPQRS